jgi:hypothetical protein
VDAIVAEGERTAETMVNEREGYSEKCARVKWVVKRERMGGCRGGRKNGEELGV